MSARERGRGMWDDVDKRDLRCTHYSFRGLGSLLDLDSAIRADTSKQHFTVIPRYWYADATLQCSRCQRDFSFTAVEQQLWYEGYRFWIESVPRQCSICRKELRRLKALRREYDRDIATAIRSKDVEIKMRVAEIIDQLLLAGLVLPSKVLANRNLLAAQITGGSRNRISTDPPD